FQAEDGIRDFHVTGVQTCALPISIDVEADEHAEFRQTLLDLYLPRYGDAWLDVLDGAAFARIDARRLFAFWMPDDDAGGGAGARSEERRVGKGCRSRWAPDQYNRR